MKKKLFIFSNESIHLADDKYYCENLDLKSTPEGLNKKFESELSKIHHKKHVAAFQSGTSAIHLALNLLGLVLFFYFQPFLLF